MWSFVDKIMEGILSCFIFYICFSICTFAFLLLLRRVDTDLPQSKVAKLQRLSNKEDELQPLSVCLWAKKCGNGISLNRIQFKKQLCFSVTNHSTVANCKMQLDTIMISHCQGDDTFVASQPTGIFCFWRNGRFLFFPKMSVFPLNFSQFPPPTQSSLLFCADVQFSCDSLCTFTNLITIQENRVL